jgi:sec-independent protein translocase protein TatA
VDAQEAYNFSSFGCVELLFVTIIILINFRAGKLSQLGEEVGKAITGFKKSLHDAVEEAVPQSAEPYTKE